MRYLAPLACLALNLRNVAARMHADANPEGYDGAPDSVDDGLDVAPDAYQAIGSDGFRMFGAFGAVKPQPCDPRTGAEGFDSKGELIGCYSVGRHSEFDAEAELHTARLALEDVDLDQPILDGDERIVDYQSTELTDLIASLAYADGGPSEGIADTSELSDTYWDAIADAHVAEMRQMDSFLARPVPAPAPLPGEMEASKAQREALVAEVTRELDIRRRLYRLATMRGDTSKARRIADKAQAYKASLRRDYGRMVSMLIPGPDATRWRFLPFTKAQGIAMGILSGK